MVVFREMTLPFLSYERIQKVLPFELEKLLPFPLHSASIDFIITKSYATEQKSDILVAAIQQQSLEMYTSLFQQASINPRVITIDLFALYGLYLAIPDYAVLQKGVALIDFGMYSTKIAYIEKGTLRGIRTLNQGIMHLAKKISDQIDVTPTESLEEIIRFGINKTNDAKSSQVFEQALSSFWDDVRFTLYAFTLHNDPKQIMDKVLLVGRGADIQDMAAFASKKIEVPCENFSLAHFIDGSKVSTKNRLTVPNTAILSLATAFPSTPTEECNLLEGLNHERANATTNAQLLTGMILTATLFILLLGISFIQVHSLSSELSASKKQAFNALREAFENADLSEKDLQGSVENAQQEVDQKEKIWFAFSGQEQTPFLEYLRELTSLIDPIATGFSIDSLSITDGKMMLKAQVKDTAALKILERDLQKSKLLSIEPQQEPSFTMNITLLKAGKEN
jgi:Tfp pilus assembly PilM family ATPase